MVEATQGSRWQRTQVRLREISERFKLGPHHTIERFGVLMTVLTVTGVMVMGMATYGAVRAGNAVLGQVALYTSEFQTSRTGVQGTVDQVYVSSDRTRAMVLMKFTSPSQMSSEAADYYVYGTGIDGGPEGPPTRLDRPLAGAIYSFGNTGFLGVLLEAPEGFSDQLINLTVRAQKELMPPREEVLQTASTNTFARFDQWRVVINPAAEQAQWLAALDSEAMPTPESVYADAVVWPAEQAKRRAIDGRLAQMKTQLDRINNYVTQMESTPVRVGEDAAVRLLPPSLPKEIDGDTVTGMSATQLREKLDTLPISEIPEIAAKTDRARMMDTYADGYTPNTYVLNSNVTMDTGVDFDWRSRSVVDGYFQTLGGQDRTLGALLGRMDEQTRPSMSSRDLEWGLSNGGTITDLRSHEAGAKALMELRNNTAQAYDDFFQLKRGFQTVDLPDLLLMELDLAEVAETATRASGPEAVDFRS